MTNPVRIKTFRASSLQDAFEQIRREFGPEASVLETKTAKRGIFGKSCFDVTASTEMKSIVKEESHREQNDGENYSEPGCTSEQSEGALDAFSEGPDAFSEGPNALSEGKASADTSSDVDSVAFHSPVARIFEPPGPGGNSKIDRICVQVGQEMLRAGLESSMVEQWILAARSTCDPSVFRDAWSLRSELLAWVRDMVHCAPPMDLGSSGVSRLALIGPTGAGKTTTVAKLAASFSMESQAKIGILQLDPRNLGPCRSIVGYTELMGWGFQSVSDLDSIAESLKKLGHCRTILVDTPGCSPSDARSLEWLENALNWIAPTATLLVLPSTCNTQAFQRYEACFGGLNPESLVLTKLDEAGGIGPLFSCLQNSSIPVSFLTNGQHVPSDLIPATNARLAQHVFSSAT